MSIKNPYMKKYYANMSEERMSEHRRKVCECKKLRYDTDEDFRNAVKTKMREAYQEKIKNNPEAMHRKKIANYLQVLNLKHRANQPIKSKKIEEYKIYLDTDSNTYKSHLL